MKILVTIGSMKEKKFTRLFKIIDELCAEGILRGENITAQVGFDEYESNYYQCFDMVNDDYFKKLIYESELIITHAGTGTVSSCIKQKKKVIVFPRLAKYEEHYDNHQLELAELFVKKRYTMCALTKAELIECIKNMDLFIPEQFISNNDRINRLIIDFIEGNYGEYTKN